VLKLFIQTTGWLVAHTPESMLRGATLVLAELVFALRRRVILSNLHHAFSEKSERARRRIGRASCRQMVETALLSLATPYLSLSRLCKIITTTPEMNALVAAQRAAPRPHVLVTPHFAYWEAVTCFPIAAPLGVEKETAGLAEAGPTTAGATTPPPMKGAKPPPPTYAEFAAVYRPMNNPELDAWLKSTRERFGIKLLSRRKGFQEAISILRRGGAVSILYDQNAGDVGALTTLLGRVCATTELPGLLAQKFSAPVVAVYARRLGFWRIAVHAEPVISAGTASEEVTRGLNRWLETKLRSDACARDSWLWAHARWKNQDKPDRRLRLEAKRNLLTDEDLLPTGLQREARQKKGSTPPQSSTRIWVRLPNWLGDVVMLIPLLRALRASRPDAQITLIGKAAFAPLFEDSALADCANTPLADKDSAPLADKAGTLVADRFIPLPPRSGFLGEVRYFLNFWKLRHSYPDCVLLFTNSTRGDLEAFLTRSPQRFGIARPGKPRPLLTHRYALPHDYDEAQHHQLHLWRDFLNHFGLEEPPVLSPIEPMAATGLQREARQTKGPTALAPRPLGLICGSENFPAKRWPIPHWVALIDTLPRELPIRLFGTEKDRAITDQIAAQAKRPVENLAGKTDLRAYCAALRDCAALVTNDTGGMHLANALGVPLVALFGPTNPVRTGPVFDAPVTILQPPRLTRSSPPNCPQTGGGNLDALTPETVRRSVTAAPIKQPAAALPRQDETGK